MLFVQRITERLFLLPNGSSRDGALNCGRVASQPLVLVVQPIMVRYALSPTASSTHWVLNCGRVASKPLVLVVQPMDLVSLGIIGTDSSGHDDGL